MAVQNVPEPVTAFLKANNEHDSKALMATFASDAIVNDAGREFINRAAIQAWLDKEIVGPKVTMDVTDTIVRRGNVIVRAKIDGEFDKTGLPDPLILTYHFSIADAEIALLIITLNKPNH